MNHQIGKRDTQTIERKNLTLRTRMKRFTKTTYIEHDPKFITTKKSKQLIEKIGKLTSKKLYEELKREVYTERIIKPGNEQIYYTVDKIQEAIRTKKWMEFKYLEYNPDKKLVYKIHGYLYELCPFTTFWSDDRYYVVGYSKKHRKIATFRIDRMEKPEVTTADAVP